jgi:hypothetical protein
MSKTVLTERAGQTIEGCSIRARTEMQEAGESDQRRRGANIPTITTHLIGSEAAAPELQ